MDRMTEKASGDEQGILITFRDMYRQLQQLVGELRDINIHVKNQIAEGTRRDISLKELDARVSALERWRYGFLASVIGSLGLAVTAVVAIILK